MAKEFNNITGRNNILRRDKAATLLKGAGISAAKTFLIDLRNLQDLKAEEKENFVFDQYTEDSQVKQSRLNTPYFSDLEIKGGAFIPLDSDTPTLYQGITLDTVLITVSQVKNIITTTLQGTNGTVKEYVNDGDFIINVSGVLTGTEPNTYPAEEVDILTTLFSIPDVLNIESEFLSRFGSILINENTGITRGVITDFNFSQSEGFRNTQLFNFTMLSDRRIELEI